MTQSINNLSARTFKFNSLSYSRVGHRALLKGSNILVFGGTNYHTDYVTDILNIDCESYELHKPLITKNSLPVEGFSLHEFDNKIYIWGGKRPTGVSDQLWKFENDLFTKVPQKGDIPNARFCHTSVIFSKKYMIIYGGMSNQTVFNDWFCLNLQTFTWERLLHEYLIPFNHEPKMIWLDTRGILLVSHKWDVSRQRAEYCCDLYEFKFRKKQGKFNLVIQKLQIQFEQNMIYRGLSSLCKYKSDFIGVAIIGGENFQQQKQEYTPQMFSDTWIINLETLQAKVAKNVKLTAQYGHEAIFYKDRILLIGGVSSLNQFSSYLQTIDLQIKMISIDRKLCQVCSGIYGLQEYTKQKMSIKCEYDSNPKSYLPSTLIKKFSESIRNPLKAFGLLIDNAINMNANLVEIQIKRINQNQKISKKKFQILLELTDNSSGFNKEQILQSFFTFGYKTQTFTHDSKFQEELTLRKEYGLNLKLASLRLGKSCLVVLNTVQDEKFIGYFSIDPTNCPEFKDRFNCFYYFLNNDNLVSSQINRHIIAQNLQNIISLEQVQNSSNLVNKIYIFDFNSREQFTFEQKDSNAICSDFEDEGSIFMNLNEYLRHLYFKPYVGRTISLSKNRVFCESLIDKFKKDEVNNQIRKLNLVKFTDQTKSFEQLSLFQVLQKEYTYKNVTIYSSNRLICNLDFSDEMMCGIAELHPSIQISIGKCGLQNYIQERQLKKYLIKLKEECRIKRNYPYLKQGVVQNQQSLSKTTKRIK